MTEFNSLSQPESTPIFQREMGPHVIASIAEQAHLAPESLNGATEQELRGESITLDPNSLEEMGENGPVAILRVGESLLKIYTFDRTVDGKTEKGFGVADAAYENDDSYDKAQNLNLVYLDSPLVFGRTTTYANRLGLAKDYTVSRDHFRIEVDNEQLQITDESTNGTRLIVREKEKHGPSELVDITLKKYFGRVAVEDSAEIDVENAAVRPQRNREDAIRQSVEENIDLVKRYGSVNVNDPKQQ